MNRDEEIHAFLQTNGWGDAERSPLQADFSTRQFVRLKRGATKAILMIADADQKTAAFVEVDTILCGCGLAAPQIYAAWPESGLVVMEDFGDVNFGKMLDGGHEAAPLYRRAIDVLVQLHQHVNTASINALSKLPVFDNHLLTLQSEWFLDHYFPAMRQRDANADERASFRQAILATLEPLNELPRTLMLRDYMPDNLMNISGKKGVQATGLLDFQDAGMGPLLYDVVSLCEAVRRDQGAALLDEMLVYYHQQNPVLPLSTMQHVAPILAVQRHIRILGNVVRFANDPVRCTYIPRMQQFMQHMLQHAAVQPLKVWLKENNLDF